MTEQAGDVETRFHAEVDRRLTAIASHARAGSLDAAVDLIVACVRGGGVVQVFGTGHSEAFAMEIAGRAGGLIPTNRIALRDLVLYGSQPVDSLGGATLERNPDIVAELVALSPIGPNDVFIIASNSGVNGSVVEMALLAKSKGHRVIAVTSSEHTRQVDPKHASGKRLSEIADVVLDNAAPFGDVTLEIAPGVRAGAVSSITAAFIAQLLTIKTAERIAATGATPPLYISANIPGGDQHNRALEQKYAGRIRRSG